MYRRSQRWMLIINNRFLSLYDYNFLLVIEKIKKRNSKICGSRLPNLLLSEWLFGIQGLWNQRETSSPLHLCCRHLTCFSFHSFTNYYPMVIIFIPVMPNNYCLQLPFVISSLFFISFLCILLIIVTHLWSLLSSF